MSMAADFLIGDEFQIRGRGTVVLLSIDEATRDTERDAYLKATHMVHEGKIYEIKGRELRGRITGCPDGTPLEFPSYGLLIARTYPKGHFKTGDLVTLVVAAEDSRVT